MSVSPEIIELNVGGHHFTTTRSTLASSPGMNSMLERMTSPEWGTAVQHPEDGSKTQCYFIDRDGSHFRNILNYLRCGDAVNLPAEEVILKDLLLEADFYQLEGLVGLINDKLSNQGLGINVVRLAKGDQVRFIPEAIESFCENIAIIFQPLNYVKLQRGICGGYYLSPDNNDCFQKCFECMSITQINVERKLVAHDLRESVKIVKFLMKRKMLIVHTVVNESCVVVNWNDHCGLHVPMSALVRVKVK